MLPRWKHSYWKEQNLAISTSVVNYQHHTHTFFTSGSLFICFLLLFVSSELAGKVFTRRIHLVYADTTVLSPSAGNFGLCGTQALWSSSQVVHKGLWRVTGASFKSLCGDFKTSSQTFWQSSHREEGSTVPAPGSGPALVAHSWPTECSKGICLTSESRSQKHCRVSWGLGHLPLESSAAVLAASVLKPPCHKETQSISKYTKQWNIGIELLYIIMHVGRWHGEVWKLWRESGDQPAAPPPTIPAPPAAWLQTHVSPWTTATPLSPSSIPDTRRQWKIIKCLLSESTDLGGKY